MKFFRERITNDLKKIRTLVQKMGWNEFMMHVGSIMAEQADKTDGSQSSALFDSSGAIHSLHHIWVGCGRFTYPEDMVDLSSETGERRAPDCSHIGHSGTTESCRDCADQLDGGHY